MTTNPPRHATPLRPQVYKLYCNDTSCPADLWQSKFLPFELDQDPGLMAELSASWPVTTHRNNLTELFAENLRVDLSQWRLHNRAQGGGKLQMRHMLDFAKVRGGWGGGPLGALGGGPSWWGAVGWGATGLGAVG